MDTMRLVNTFAVKGTIAGKGKGKKGRETGTGVRERDFRAKGENCALR